MSGPLTCPKCGVDNFQFDCSCFDLGNENASLRDQVSKLQFKNMCLTEQLQKLKYRLEEFENKNC